MEAKNGNGKQQWFTWSIGIISVALISLANIVYANGKNITTNTAQIESDRRLTQVKLTYIEQKIDEIKVLIQKP